MISTMLPPSPSQTQKLPCEESPTRGAHLVAIVVIVDLNNIMDMAIAIMMIIVTNTAINIIVIIIS